MKKQQENHIASNINTFDKEVSIFKVLFQDKTTSLLKYLADKIVADRYEQRDYKLPSIVLYGVESKQLISQAFSNSLCYDFEHLQGKHLGLGGSFGSLLEDSEQETSYYISQADKLSAYSISQFHKFLTLGYIRFRDHIRHRDLTVSAINKLFIFGVNDLQELDADLSKAIDYHCYLRHYTESEMSILIEQRLRWCNIKYTKEVPAVIARNGAGSMKSCIRLLSLANLVTRGDGRSKITIKDVEIGIGLNKQVGISPPPLPDDIPF